MSINDAQAYVKSLWDWSYVTETILPKGCYPSDIDGVLEHNGFFLFFETKGHRVSIPQGQLRLIYSITKNPMMTYFVVWGKTNDPDEFQVYTSNYISKIMSCDIYILRSAINYWWLYAEQGKQITIKPENLWKERQ